MDKINAIKDYLLELPVTKIFKLHNDYCKENSSDMMLYEMTSDNLDMYFHTPSDLFHAIKLGNDFNFDKPYFRFVNDAITTNVESVIDYDELAEFLINNGDYGYGFDITPHLMNKFKVYAYDLLQEEYTLQQIENCVETSQMDFLMDDWDDIILDFENVVAFCPHCKSVVFADAKHEYIYETAKILWECDNCGEEFQN